MSESKIQKWGNSMALRIPAPLLRGLNLSEGQSIALSIEGDALVVRPTRKKYELDALIAQCKPVKARSKAEREWLDNAAVGLEEI
jgi:antitoxin ChpS